MDKVKVEARNIRLSYGATPVLREVSLAVEPGEFFALLGPSGSGKSTLLRLIAGFNRQQSGEIFIGGREVTNLEPWKRNVGMVFQNYALWPHMTVAKNVAFGLEERKLPRDEIRRKVDAALELVGLSGYGARRPAQLSGGQQQRVALARTLAIEPQVLLLDEPLSNLDAKLRVQMRRELQRLHRRLGITTIFVTHDQEEALTICDRIAVLDQGVVQQVGTPVELFDHPANRFVAQFVGSVNFHEGKAFRPHAVSFGGEAPGGLELDGVVEGGEFLGEFMRYEVRVGDALIIADQPHLRGRELLAKGTRVRMCVPAGEVRVIP
jgi:iron(III) transport system ATP-binding protein